MSITLQSSPGATGLTVYAVIYDDPNRSNQVWDQTSLSLVDFSPLQWSHYAIALVETASGTRLYRGTWTPPATGTYVVQTYQQLDSAPASRDMMLKSAEVATDGIREVEGSSVGVDQKSAVNLCNLALGHLGVSVPIASLTEDSIEARMCNLYYEPTRNELMRGRPWPFATRYITLGLVQENPSPDWLYAYRYPADAIAVRRLVTDMGRFASPRPAFHLGSDGGGKLVYCDLDDAQVEYTANITNPVQFDAQFSAALTWLLASKLAPTISGKPSVQQTAIQMFELQMRQAATEAANESQGDVPPDSEFITARY